MLANLGRVTVLAVAIASAGCETVYGPTSPSAEWATFDSASYTLYARPGSFCAAESARLAEVLEHQYAHAAALLNIPIGGRISMFLYNAGSEVKPPLPGTRSGVAFPDTNAVHAVCTPPNDIDLRALLMHEANHVIMQNGLGRAGTSFMNEGLASALVSDAYGDAGPALLRRWAANNRARLIPLATLADDSKWDSNSNDGYRTSASFLAYLLDRYGPAPLKQLYYARSQDFARRVQEIYGKSLEVLEAEWLSAI